ncbi:hypothetical protein ABEB36_007376 [Hypothenemus hampei]|uniref:Acyltransferase 3 domain-containing protein n=1 Tax=Hypothenemus hampei TaxID=57062 RepID=A0ABD1ETT3_HYPHA
MQLLSVLLTIFLANCIKSHVTDKQYGYLPDLFIIENYDNCMMLEDEAFYCNLVFEVQPLDEEHPGETWHIINNLSEIKTNYRHDHLRHWICVPKACPGIKKSSEDDVELKQQLEKCYNEKVKKFDLKGRITKLRCETNQPKYPVDYFDVLVAIFFVAYFGFIFYSTFREGIARYQTPDEYEKFISGSSTLNKIFAACSITRNWIKLKTIKTTLEIEKLRHIQGIRVYNTALVIFVHSILGFLASPVGNTRYVETMHEKNAILFISSGPLCVATFFLISSFLLTNGIFEHMKEKKMNIRTIIFIFINRFFRLTPVLLATVLFHSTLLRHLGNGPFWNIYIGDEYKRCRKNGWSTVLYVNIWYDTFNMCLPLTWYLSLDTLYFLLSLLFLWLLKTYEKRIWYLLGAALSFNIIGTFCQNYLHGFSALDLPAAEKYYELNHLFTSFQFQYQLCSFIGNSAGPIMGMAFGYYFFKHKYDKTPLFGGKISPVYWWFATWALGLSLIIFPGLIITNEKTEPNRIWASIYVALSRPIFSFVIGTAIIGFSEGVGCKWLFRHIFH